MKSLLILLFVFAIGICKAQDTLLYMNGKDKVVEYQRKDSLEVFFKKDGKEKSAYSENIFAIGTAQGRIYIYEQDTAGGDDFTVEQMEQYQKGLRLGLASYNTDLAAGGGFVVGAGGTMALNSGFYGWLPIMAYLGVTAAVPVKESKFKLSEDQMKNDFLVIGYTDGANRRRIKRIALTGTIGVFSGIIGYTTLAQ